MRITTKFSYEDLQDIPPDRNRYEIVDGELFVTAASIPVHQRIVMNLAAHLWQFLRAHRMGEVLITPLDVVFTSETVLEPDIIFVSQARLDREIKPKQYARYGVPEFFVAWILRERPSKFFG